MGGRPLTAAAGEVVTATATVPATSYARYVQPTVLDATARPPVPARALDAAELAQREVATAPLPASAYEVLTPQDVTASRPTFPLTALPVDALPDDDLIAPDRFRPAAPDEVRTLPVEPVPDRDIGVNQAPVPRVPAVPARDPTDAPQPALPIPPTAPSNHPDERRMTAVPAPLPLPLPDRPAGDLTPVAPGDVHPVGPGDLAAVATWLEEAARLLDAATGRTGPARPASPRHPDEPPARQDDRLPADDDRRSR